MQAPSLSKQSSLLASLLAEPAARFERRIARAKAKEYPRRSPEAWTAADHAGKGTTAHLACTVADALERVDAGSLSPDEFSARFERRIARAHPAHPPRTSNDT